MPDGGRRRNGECGLGRRPGGQGLLFVPFADRLAQSPGELAGGGVGAGLGESLEGVAGRDVGGGGQQRAGDLPEGEQIVLRVGRSALRFGAPEAKARHGPAHMPAHRSPDQHGTARRHADRLRRERPVHLFCGMQRIEGLGRLPHQVERLGEGGWPAGNRRCQEATEGPSGSTDTRAATPGSQPVSARAPASSSQSWVR